MLKLRLELRSSYHYIVVIVTANDIVIIFTVIGILFISALDIVNIIALNIVIVIALDIVNVKIFLQYLILLLL